eukprot:TRINITY_DN10338_c0_g1_i1.p1 TRINITY_DN10338_c0_g1~~TRINITY_DN10338_c0_g1_i1.p1  ORF type:complete len:156 (+),score=18.90 TRINITY_DN10338_c0_g1_i1:55-468(+)
MARGLLLACVALLVLQANAVTQAAFNGNWGFTYGSEHYTYTIGTVSDGVYELFSGFGEDPANSIGQGFFSSNTLAFSNAHGTVYAVHDTHPPKITWSTGVVWTRVEPAPPPPGPPTALQYAWVGSQRVPTTGGPAFF